MCARVQIYNREIKHTRFWVCDDCGDEVHGRRMKLTKTPGNRVCTACYADRQHVKDKEVCCHLRVQDQGHNTNLIKGITGHVEIMSLEMCAAHKQMLHLGHLGQEQCGQQS